jgi:hypothetical protein
MKKKKERQIHELDEEKIKKQLLAALKNTQVLDRTPIISSFIPHLKKATTLILKEKSKWLTGQSVIFIFYNATQDLITKNNKEAGDKGYEKIGDLFDEDTLTSVAKETTELIKRIPIEYELLFPLNNLKLDLELPIKLTDNISLVEEGTGLISHLRTPLGGGPLLKT